MEKELMKQDNPIIVESKKPFREQFLRKKVLLIAFAAFVVLGGGGTVAVVKASDNPAFCTLCHNMQPYYDSWKDSNLLANKHAAADVKCHDCHEASLSLQAEEGFKYITGDYKTPLDKRAFATEEFCTQCHDFSDAKAKTNFAESNPHDSHNGDLQCNTCHNMHQQSDLFCKQCHNFDWFSNLGSYWK